MSECKKHGEVRETRRDKERDRDNGETRRDKREKQRDREKEGSERCGLEVGVGLRVGVWEREQACDGKGG